MVTSKADRIIKTRSAVIVDNKCCQQPRPPDKVSVSVRPEARSIERVMPEARTSSGPMITTEFLALVTAV